MKQLVLPIKDSYVLSEVQDTLLNNFKAGLRNYTIFQVGKATLLRVSDVLRLKQEDVYDKYGEVKRNAFIKDKKTGKQNTLYLKPRNLVQRGCERLRVSGQLAAVLVGVILTRPRDRKLNQRRPDRRENRTQYDPQEAQRPGIAVIVIATAEIHKRIAKICDDRRHGGCNGRGENVVVVHVHQLVAEHAAHLALIENLQNALRAAYGRVMLVEIGRAHV